MSDPRPRGPSEAEADRALKSESSDQQSKPRKGIFDGEDFLSHLRASSVAVYSRDGLAVDKEDTVHAGNKFSADSAPVMDINANEVANSGEPPRLPPADLLPGMKLKTPTPDEQGENPGASSSSKSLPTAAIPSTLTGKPPVVPAILKRPATIHTRGVSWGKDNVFEHNIQQPQLDRAFPAPSSATNFDYSPDSEGKVNSQQQRRRQRTAYSIDELLGDGTYEFEAESNILKALEQSSRSRMRLDTAGSHSEGSHRILSNVPDSVAHDFSLNSPSKDNAEDADGTDHGSRSLGSHQSRNERLQAMSPRREESRRQHRRDMSVEEKLHGLATAMMNMHDGMKPMIPRIDEMEPLVASGSGSSADQLAHNAAIIASHAENLHAPPSPTRAKQRWAKIAGNVGVLKESEEEDNGDEYEGDREEGGGYDRSEDDDVESQRGATAENTSGSETSNHRKKRKTRVASNLVTSTTDKIKEEMEVWNNFFRPRQARVWSFAKSIILFVMIPATGISALLFYVFGNPTTGVQESGVDSPLASASWWLLFIFVRQLITFSLALAAQLFIIDFLALGTRVMLRLLGSVLTLLIVQSKGWPFVVFFWGVFDFAMLFGTGPFAKHWLYWQDPMALFNEKNPSGHIVDSFLYQQILTIALCLSAIVAVKRLTVGLYLGRQTFTRYGEQLASVLRKMVLVSEVANLAKDIEKSALATEETMKKRSMRAVMSENFGWDVSSPGDDDDDITETSASYTHRSGNEKDIVIDTTKRDPLTGSLHHSEKMKLMQLLGQWEEPEGYAHRNYGEKASISAVLRFRNALTLIHKRFPFSYAFGPADTRTACVDSSQHVYSRLMMESRDEPCLKFETLALIALDGKGVIDQSKAKEILKLFRPDRDGNLTMLDFVKSVDSIYKEYRLLQATIDNSSQIDRAFENILNVVFYVIVFAIILWQLGFDPLALFLSLSSVILAFAFMIGSASSKYFEGLLFILARRPYGIGDLIHASNVERDTNIDGSTPWMVDHVTLFETTLVWLPTNERASISNGSLANSRIINWTRSPRAQFLLFLKFPIDTSYERVLVFKRSIEEYMRVRPREWVALNGFRITRVETDRGYVEWVIVIQHREGWHKVAQVLNSKSNLYTYCLEVCRKLNMNYRAPPLPVDLRYPLNDSVRIEHDNGGLGAGRIDSGAERRRNEQDVDSLRSGLDGNQGGRSRTDTMDEEVAARQFRAMAKNKYNIEYG